MFGKKNNTAIISIGSNLKNRIENCRQGIEALARLEEIEITGNSRFYQTAPVDHLAVADIVHPVLKKDMR